MKLGIVFTAIGIVSLIALVVILAMNLIMGNYINALYGTVALGIFGGMSLNSGIKRMRKVRQ